MPKLENGYVQINGGTIVYEQFTTPEQKESGSLQYFLKVVFDANNPDLAVLNEMAQQSLNNDPKMRGTLPAGGHWALKNVGPDEFGGMFPNHVLIKPTSKFQVSVFDENGATLTPMQYGNLIFPGQRVNVVVNTYSYCNVSKGVGSGLDGFQIIASANAQRLQLGGGGGGAAAAAFGGGGGQQPQQQQQQFGQQQAPQQQFGQQPQQAPQQQFGQPQQPAPEQQFGQQQAPQQQQQFGQQAPQQQQQFGQQAPQQQQQFGQQAPQQSTGFLPGQ